ncbi:MAG: N-6 DNA methylase [Metallibacterium scheffleri]|jgi:hypothetical protein|uniref:N-6 DNA methylase n=1 Tax=Metallibacterium scheffleri TaxID=993689 RepID=UPI0026E93F2A|nr:N-6 DNA methylase [Metallibacterium scheffleri]MCK9367679.1 N-6 DNA methylase [Metallibacterium scheffleri]
MLDTTTKRRIDSARDILVGKVPDPKSQVEQITIALIYKFMDDMDADSEELGGQRKFFTGDYARYGWAKLMRGGLGGHETLNLYAEGIAKMPENAGIPPLFRDIFKNAYLPYRDPETLKSFLKIIDEFAYDHSERLGDAFEYLLSVLGSQGDAGQFRTPRHIIDFMVAVLDPKKTESVLDPACGTAGFRHHALLPTASSAAAVITASRRASAVQDRAGATRHRTSSRQRANVHTPMPTSRATTSSAPLSGGSKRATARSLNRCPYRATSVLHRRLQGRGSMEATTSLTRRGTVAARRGASRWACAPRR